MLLQPDSRLQRQVQQMAGCALLFLDSKLQVQAAQSGTETGGGCLAACRRCGERRDAASASLSEEMVRGVRPALRGLRGDRRAASYATAAALSTPTAIRTAALAAALAANAVPATISAAIVIDGYTGWCPL